MPFKTTERVCSLTCALAYAKSDVDKKNAKAWRKEKKIRKEGLKTHKDYLNDLQKVFNEFIRVRDKGKPCVSCGCRVKGNGHASHMFSVGSSPSLRFNEDNVWRSCVECNLHKHGNIAEYSIRLREKIGEERFNSLVVNRNIPLKLSVEEIKQLIVEYRQKIKSLKYA